MNSQQVKLIYAGEDGSLYTDPNLLAVGVNGQQVEVADRHWVDLPVGSEVMVLPGRLPMGYDQKSQSLEVIEGFTAVAAILPVGFTRCLLPGYELGKKQGLPLFGYTAVGAAPDRFKVAAIKTDEDLKWNPSYYNTTDLSRLIDQKRQIYPHNRILRQLAKCALEYHCLTAQNIFYTRWEAGIPVSPSCNANCLGCISRQPAECCPSPQGRIDFVPAVQEVVELAVSHLENASEAIVSFGQGCEGEPSIQRELLVKSITEIRKQTSKGTINLNSNAGDVGSIRALVDAGLDSIRVSLFSAVTENYNWYHRPEGYQLKDVKESLHYAALDGLMVALNLLFFPGFTNQAQETKALFQLIAATEVKQLQLRNLNLDPEKLTAKIIPEELPTVSEWLTGLRKEFPGLLIGNYTKPK